jgi:hypothetical protein
MKGGLLILSDADEKVYDDKQQLLAPFQPFTLKDELEPPSPQGHVSKEVDHSWQWIVGRRMEIRLVVHWW